MILPDLMSLTEFALSVAVKSMTSDAPSGAGVLGAAQDDESASENAATATLEASERRPNRVIRLLRNFWRAGSRYYLRVSGLSP